MVGVRFVFFQDLLRTAFSACHIKVYLIGCDFDFSWSQTSICDRFARTSFAIYEYLKLYLQYGIFSLAV